nr:unnamed protein product [Callosobruchus analis]
MFASSTLSATEKKYSNLEREGLTIMFGLRKFHKYIYGRKFVLVTDHEPLKFILGRNKGIPVAAAARITRWAITLSGYDYSIIYKQGKLISNADGLSRLPSNESTGVTDCLYSFSLTDEIPLNSGDIAFETKNDVLLTKVLNFTKSGFPKSVDEELKPYFRKRQELSVEQNCLMLGNKVIVPEKLRQKVL